MPKSQNGSPWKPNWREPTTLLIIVVLFLVSVGGLLLWMPWASQDGTFANPITAFFTAISAVSLTGLTVVDTSSWTTFGQIVIMMLSFVGGLGLITGFALALIILRQRIGIQNRMLIRADAGTGNNIPNISTTIRNILILAITAQIVAAIILFTDIYFINPLWDNITIGEAIWQAIFHAVAGFNNSGLEIFPDNILGGSSLVELSTQYISLSTILLVSVIGAISYPVLQDLWITKGRLGKLQLDSKLILWGTVIVAGVGGVAFFLLEFNNNNTLGDLPIGAQILSALFESSSTRISGFTTVDQTQLNSATQILNNFLIFIGGAAGSTSGGLKIGTIAILLLFSISLFRGFQDVRAFRRTVTQNVVRRALLLSLWIIAIWIILSFALAIAQPTLDLFGTVFEVASALTSAGLSLGITPELNMGGRIIIMLAMLLGRFGIAYILLRQFSHRHEQHFQYPEEDVRIG